MLGYELIGVTTGGVSIIIQETFTHVALVINEDYDISYTGTVHVQAQWCAGATHW